jgi:hypothetical protein
MATNPVVPAPAPLSQLPAQEPAPLSEGQRLLGTFFSPSKVFTDLRRNASWWAPFLLMAIISFLFVYVVDQKVGFQKVAENQIHSQPKQAERMESMPAADREKAMVQQVKWTRNISYGFFVIIPIWLALVAAVLLATVKFAAGAEVKFKTLFALVMYASVPGLLKSLLAIFSILAGVSSDGFTFQNPVATNPGYFLDPASSPVLYSVLTKCDIFTFWTLALTAIGLTCISKVKTGTAFAIVFGWFALLTLVGAGFTAAFA